LFLILSLLSCNSIPQTAKASQAQAQQPQTTPQYMQASPVFWTGDGGKGKSIAILSPRASGLAESQSYLPDLVQGEFVSNFSSFSAISVLDRANLDEQYSELLSGYYDDNSTAGMDLGHLTPTDYIMGGTITKTSTGYALQMRVTKTADKMTAASFSGTCTFDELDNLTGIRKVSLDLLQKLGVEPTAKAKTELAVAASSNHVEAQTALARGISAQRQGTEVEALSYYFQAAALDASLLEATSRSSVMFANIASGNIGENTRNDIEWRRQWVARLTETEQYFNDLLNANSMPYTLLYSTEIIPGTVNYQTETQTLSINTNLHATGGIWLSSMERALQAVYDGLDATNKKQVWGLQNWPSQSITNLKPFETKNKNFSISAELVNSNGKVIGSTIFQARGWWNFSTSHNRSPVINISDDDRKQVSFTNVKADDITDRLAIRIASVNGIDAQTAAQTGVLQIKAISKEEWDNYLSFTMVKGVLTGYDESDRSSALVIPDLIWGEPVTTIGSRAFQRENLTSVTIPDSVTSIGSEAFAYNQIVTLTIGNSVNSIGPKAFSNNRLASVTIPASVVSIGNEAFVNNQITVLNIGSSVNSIGAIAFANNQLNSVTIPDSVTSIGNEAFVSNGIATITIGANVNFGNTASVYYYDAGGYYSRFIEYYNVHGRIGGVYFYTALKRWDSSAIGVPEEQQTQALTNSKQKAFAATILSLLALGGLFYLLKDVPLKNL